MSFQPVLPLVALIPLCLIFIALGTWLCLRTLRHASSKITRIVLGLRLVVLLALALMLINPGEWRAQDQEDHREWVVMLDTSASMSVKEGELSRLEGAKSIVEKINTHAAKEDVNLKVHSFTDILGAELEDPDSLVDAKGEQSRVESAAKELLEKFNSAGRELAGVIVLSDGRQTTDSKDESFYMKAKASNVAFHGLPIGADFPTPDIDVTCPYRLVSAFAGQDINVTAHVQIKNSDKKVAKLELLDESGALLDSVDLDLSEGGAATHSFSLKAPEKSTSFTLRTEAIEDEVRLANNEAKVSVRILESQTRVFIAEGAPYWDSKFFAQLLRQQKHMDVTAVYRFSSTRWFMINSDNAKPFETNQKVFPDSVEALAKFDLIVLGKNIDGFMTPKIAQNLRQYVREQGGAVLFARGKSFSSKWADLEILEPVHWKNQRHNEFRMSPTQEGELIGLFGQALPGKDSSIWAGLPKLKDAHGVDMVKPFTRVLAMGDGQHGEFPLLMVRRYGQGVCGMINADGLWKWDFFPEVKSMGNMYNEFWSQLIQWMVSYSEFLPGYEHSMHLSSTSVKSGEIVALRLGYRGSESPGDIKVQIESQQLASPVTVVPARSVAQDGRIEWRTTLNYDKPGVYRVKMLTDSETPLPETSFTVEAPPGEFDELSADTAFLENLSHDTGGVFLNQASLDTFLKETVVQEKATIENGQIQWYSYWMHWLVAAALVLIMGSEWWIRRRNGLI